MSKVTSKLQVTVPKALARQYGIRPGDEIEWSAAGDALRVEPMLDRSTASLDLRLKLFDEATERQRRRQAKGKRQRGRARGWTRVALYGRGVPG